MSDHALAGGELAREFHADVVRPLLTAAMPGLRYAAGRLGSGSDVLGFDDAMSRDHDWGCRLTVLVDEADRAAIPHICLLLERELPESYRGLPVRFPVTWDSSCTHQVEIATVAGFAASRLGIDPTAGLSAADWLVLTGQSVLEVTAGPVFADRTAGLAPVRARLNWYPPDIERYVLAAGWQRLSQEMPMVGRTAEHGDEVGSRMLSTRLADDLISLAFTLSRQWSPYPKWRGTAFRALPVSADLAGLLTAAEAAPHWRDRESALQGRITDFQHPAQLLRADRDRPPEPAGSRGGRVSGQDQLPDRHAEPGVLPAPLPRAPVAQGGLAHGRRLECRQIGCGQMRLPGCFPELGEDALVEPGEIGAREETHPHVPDTGPVLVAARADETQFGDVSRGRLRADGQQAGLAHEHAQEQGLARRKLSDEPYPQWRVYFADDLVGESL